MKNQIEDIVLQALNQLVEQQVLLSTNLPHPQVNRCKDPSHGDWSTNVAMVLAKPAKMPPRQLAEKLVAAISTISQDSIITKVDIAGPGFINFFVDANSQLQVINTVLQKGAQYGKSSMGEGQKILVEFVSANPTGPLHVGHGRGAAYGASLANLLSAAGYHVEREYYVNDAGRQMNILAVSIWLRYLALHDVQPFSFPEKIYQGDYVIDIAKQLKNERGNHFCRESSELTTQMGELTNLSDDEFIDTLIESAKTLLDTDYPDLFQVGLETILADIRDDLGEFGIEYENWFSEASLEDSIPSIVERLSEHGYIYESEGAKWFRSTDFGDDKDRVVIRENGQGTYFASDIAYHYNKYQRGFDKVVNIWGADHHGYIARVKAAISALKLDPDQLDVMLVQFAILYRGEERLQMSTRSGSFVTLRSLRDEVGNDAARFFYVTRKSEQHMDFDLDLAKSQSKDNPVYYIQYAHARICSVLDKASEKGFEFKESEGLAALNRLENDHELALISKLSEYPEIIERAAKGYEPHSIATYLKELASDFHTYYNANIVLVDDTDLRQARLCLSLAARQVIANGLAILGVSAPQRM